MNTKARAKPTLNDDGYSVKGCSYIYAPRGQAGEYSPLAANPYRGCGHKCRYCYVPNVLRMSRQEFDEGAEPRPYFIKKLTQDAAKYRQLGLRGQVMLSFTTDPYHPGDTSLTRETLEVLISHGLGICTLTKGGTKSIRDIDLFRKDRDAFASTLTSLDNDFSLRWEPDAALPGDRIQALREFHDRGIFTWVSLEPTLDCDASVAIIEATRGFVDLYKIGQVNYSGLTLTTDWQAYTSRMVELVDRLGVGYYFKKDLQGYLPVGFDNPMRVNQFHQR